MAKTVVGRDGNTSPALPLQRVREILAERILSHLMPTK